MLVKILRDSRELSLCLPFFLLPSLSSSCFFQFCLTICLINVKLPKVIMEAYQLDTKLSLVHNLVLLLWCICTCVYVSVWVCNMCTGVFVSAFVQLNGAVPMSHTCVRGRHVVALVLFSLNFFHFRFSHSHAFTLALTHPLATFTLSTTRCKISTTFTYLSDG